MVITNEIIDGIAQKAKVSPRLRANLCLHQSPEDKVQKMINVLLPGTQMHVHRHLNTDETLVLLRGSITIVYYNTEGIETERIELSKDSISAIDIPQGQWHNIIVDQPVALLEIKEGPYRPLLPTEIK